MSKGPSPLLGFNNNVRHKGRVFHIQTEDSGIRHPHVITHLFMDGGRIVKTTKTSYAEHLGNEKLQEVVRDLMKQQHKAMFVALRDGEYDEIIARKAGGSGEMAKVGEAAPAAPAENGEKLESARRPSVRPSQPRSPSVRPPSVRPPSVRPPSVRPPSVRPQEIARGKSTRPPPAEAPARPVAALRPPAPDPLAPPPSDVEVDVSALERAAAAAASDAAEQRRGVPAGFDLPPPPAAVLQKPRSEGTYREVVTQDRARKSTAPSGRYSVRPAPPAEPTPPPEPRSIFGEDLISEKSLDEVILSYLAEDLDGASPKK